MTSTAYDDQFVTITVGGSGGGGGAGKNYYTGHGATGSYTVPSGTLTMGTGSSYTSSTSMSTSILSIMAEGDGDAMIKTKKNTINLDEMAEMMNTLKERLLILTPNFQLHEHYPALKEAYEHYKVLEAMLAAGDK